MDCIVLDMGVAKTWPDSSIRVLEVATQCLISCLRMRAILFDFGGTLDYPLHWLDRFLAHYRAAGVSIGRSELDRAFSKATQMAYRAGIQRHDCNLAETVSFLVVNQIDELRRNGQAPLIAIIDKCDGSNGALARQITSAFVAESVLGLGRSRRVLSSLAGRFKIGVVSNFYGNLDRVLAEAGIAVMLDTVVDSTCLGIYKPDERIFETALKALEVAPADALMVGDSLEKDCAPARRLGMRTAWLRHSETATRHPNSQLADFTLDSLEGLENLEWWTEKTHPNVG